MALPTNPQTLATYNLLNGGQAKVFVKNVSDILISIYQSIVNLSQSIAVLSTPAGLAAILNGSGLLQNSALLIVNQSASGIATNQTFSAANATSVSVNLGFTAAITLTLQNIPFSVPVYVRVSNGTAGALNFKIAATNPSSSSYAVRSVSVSAGAELDMTATGFSVPAAAQQHWFGMTNTGGLFLVSL